MTPHAITRGITAGAALVWATRIGAHGTGGGLGAPGTDHGHALHHADGVPAGGAAPHAGGGLGGARQRWHAAGHALAKGGYDLKASRDGMPHTDLLS